jgi:hypothetical protein
MRPAFFAAAVFVLAPVCGLAPALATTCAIPTACLLEANSGAGAGIEGTSLAADGIVGITTYESTSGSLSRAGVYGQDSSTNGKAFDFGVLGTSTTGTGTGGRSRSSFGVSGISATFTGVYGLSGAKAGVYGETTAGAQSALGDAAGVIGVNDSTSGSPNIAGVIGKTGGPGFGVVGLTTDGAQAGVYGFGTTGYGVFGLSGSAPGVSGSSDSNSGVSGSSDSSNGVSGSSNSGTGVYGSSTSGYGVYASGGYGLVAYGSTEGVFGASTGSGPGVEALALTGTGIYAHTSTGIGGRFTNSSNNPNPAASMRNYAGNGTDSQGTYIGVVGRAPADEFPLVLTDDKSNNVFFVDGAGNVEYHGKLKAFAKTAAGREATAFAAKTTSPTLEDVGSGQITAGQGAVTFDPVFASELDPREPYHVFLTPEGDTRGLYVAVKTARGFVVREAQGGRSSVAFDYRVVGTELGSGGRRTAFVDRDRAGPYAPIVNSADSRAPSRATLRPAPPRAPATAVDRSLHP